MTARALLLSLALVACDGGDAPPAQPKIPVISGQQVDHAASEPGAFDKSAFSCCATPAATAVVGAYVGLGEALAADDLAKAVERASSLSSAVAAATTDPATTAEMRPHLESMAALTDRMAGQPIDAVREEFLDLTKPALAYAAANQGGDLSVSVAFCPMKPGRWLQLGAPIANPYYGAEMLTCGVFEALPEAG